MKGINDKSLFIPLKLRLWREVHTWRWYTGAFALLMRLKQRVCRVSHAQGKMPLYTVAPRLLFQSRDVHRKFFFVTSYSRI